jgi:hypothetical protein
MAMYCFSAVPECRRTWVHDDSPHGATLCVESDESRQPRSLLLWFWQTVLNRLTLICLAKGSGRLRESEPHALAVL